MEQTKYTDFLTATTDSIRHSIRYIDDSYNNYWDIFAELAQNAVDAINKTDRPGAINLEVDCRARNIVFQDNGCGISPTDLPRLLNLFSSGKTNDNDSIGEKGVGLKFVLFQSSKFVITTCVPAAVDMMPEAERELPYEGAKEMLLVEDVEDSGFLEELLERMYQELPVIRKKK